MPEEDLIAWALAEVERLRSIASSGAGRSASAEAEVRGALEVLRRCAPGSALEQGAQDALRGAADDWILEDVARCLEQWVQLTRNGLLAQQPYEVRARVDAATDLMEQVQRLLDDKDMHPAAPIVLAGAALEELLRSMIAAGHHEVNGKPSLTAYGATLQKANVLDRQAAKEIVAWAGLRNAAAHGDFNDLTRQRAQVMVEGINLFMQRWTPALSR